MTTVANIAYSNLSSDVFELAALRSGRVAKVDLLRGPEAIEGSSGGERGDYAGVVMKNSAQAYPRRPFRSKKSKREKRR